MRGISCGILIKERIIQIWIGGISGLNGYLFGMDYGGLILCQWGGHWWLMGWFREDIVGLSRLCFRVVTRDCNYCLVIARKWRSFYPCAILFVCLSQSTLAIRPQVTISIIMGQTAITVAKVGKSFILKGYPLFFIIIQSDHPSVNKGSEISTLT